MRLNLFGIYLLEMAQGLQAGAAAVLFLSFIVMVPYDYLFHREKIRANWQDMKNVFGIFAGKIPQVKKKKEPPAWNVWFTRNRIIKTGPDVFRPLDPKLDLSAFDGTRLLLAKLFLSVLVASHFPYAVIAIIQQHGWMTSGLEAFLHEFFPVSVLGGDPRLRMVHAVFLIVETTLLFVTDIIDNRRSARRCGVSRMLSSMRMFFMERMSEKEAEEASFFVAMLADRLGEEQKKDIVEQTSYIRKESPEIGREFIETLCGLYNSSAESGSLTEAGESMMGKIKNLA